MASSVTTRKIWQDLRSEMTVSRIVIFVLGTVAGLSLAAFFLSVIGIHLPVWIWVLAVLAAVFMQFARWLRPGRYNKATREDS